VVVFVCNLQQNHADRNASVNIARREKAKLDGNDSNYRTYKTQAAGAVGASIRVKARKPPPSPRSLAEQGMLSHG